MKRLIFALLTVLAVAASAAEGDITYRGLDFSVEDDEIPIADLTLAAGSYTILDAGVTELACGSAYVVTGRVELATLTLTGSGDFTTLVVTDGARLAVTGTPGRASVTVPGVNIFYVCGQSGNTGELVIRGSAGNSAVAGLGSRSMFAVCSGAVALTAGEGASTISPELSAEAYGGVYNAEAASVFNCKGGLRFVPNESAAMKAGYPYMLAEAWRVELGEIDSAALTVAWTYGDGSVVSPVTDSSFSVPRTATGVKVFFTPVSPYEFADPAETGVLELGALTRDVDLSSRIPELYNPLLDNRTVKVGAVEGCDITYSAGGGAEQPLGADGSFSVRSGTTDVKVFFTPRRGYSFAPGSSGVVSLGTVTENVVFSAYGEPKLPQVRFGQENVPYVDWDPVSRRFTNAVLRAGTYARVSGTRGDGWCVAFSPEEFDSFRITGAAKLLLAEDSAVAATSVVIAAGASLAVYGQSAGAGRLSGPVTGAGTLTVNGGTVGGDVAVASVTVRRGSAGGSLAGSESVTVTGGLFAEKPADAWLFPGCAALANPDAATRAEFPWRVPESGFVGFTGAFDRMTAAIVSGDGSISNAVSELRDGEMAFPAGTLGAKVVFTPEAGFSFTSGVAVVTLPSPFAGFAAVTNPVAKADPLTVTVVFGEGVKGADYRYTEDARGEARSGRSEAGFVISDVRYGTDFTLANVAVDALYDPVADVTVTVSANLTLTLSAAAVPAGTEGNPWRVGPELVAWTNSAGRLVFEGSGAMETETAPWDPAAVREVSFPESATPAAEAFADLGDGVVIDGLAFGRIRELVAAAGSGAGGGGGAPEGSVPVTGGKAVVRIAVESRGDLAAGDWSGEAVSEAVRDEVRGGAELSVGAAGDRRFYRARVSP